MIKKLTIKQQRFIEEYPKDFNGTQSYIRAGYTKNGAEVSACKLLRNPKVIAALAVKKEALSKKCAISTERVVKEWNCIAFMNPDDLFTVDGNGVHTFRRWEDIPERAKRAISEMQNVKLADGSMGFKVRFHSKPVALRNLGELNGDYIDRKEIGEPGEFEKLNDEQLDAEITRRTIRASGHAEGEGEAEGQQEPDRIRRLHP